MPKHNIHLLTIIGEVEGHETLSNSTKTTKYEEILPKLADFEQNDEIDGLLILLHTVGGDVEAGLAIAEMISSLSKPTVSLVLGGGHSIGVPMAVSTNYSFIVPSATMVIHPVRSSGTFIGVMQSFRNMERIQDRITSFIATNSKISEKRVLELMLDSKQLVKDVGTMVGGEQAVEEGLIDEIGGIQKAFEKLNALIDEYKLSHPCLDEKNTNKDRSTDFSKKQKEEKEVATTGLKEEENKEQTEQTKEDSRETLQ